MRGLGNQESTVQKDAPLLRRLNEGEVVPAPGHKGPGMLGDGRGASQSWLQGSPDPMTTMSWQTWDALNPETAAKLGVKDGDIVQVSSPHGEWEAPV